MLEIICFEHPADISFQKSNFTYNLTISASALCNCFFKASFSCKQQSIELIFFHLDSWKLDNVIYVYILQVVNFVMQSLGFFYEPPWLTWLSIKPLSSHRIVMSKLCIYFASRYGGICIQLFLILLPLPKFLNI